MTVQGPEVVRVGRVSAVYWPGHATAAVSLAEYADRTVRWPGLDLENSYPIRLILAPDSRVIDSISDGRVPSWRAGVAFPGTNTVMVVAGRQAPSVLRHELAHLALHQQVRRVPRWFDEGYASRAAGEWNRLEALRVNLAVARGRVPTLARLNQELRSTASRAEMAYALSTTAVLFLERLGGDRGLGPLLATLRDELSFDAALRRTHRITLDQFEDAWRRDVRKRYGWAWALTSLTLFWALVSLLVFVVWGRKRRRDRQRWAALDEGWVVADEEPPAS